MTACMPAPRKINRLPRTDGIPPKPDRRLWKADPDRAFEAGARWFLAVSRAASFSRAADATARATF